MKTHYTLIAITSLCSLNIAHAGFIEIDAGSDLVTYSLSSGSWGDYDGDGDVDLFIPGSQDGLNILYRNLGNGKFDRPDAFEIGELASDTLVAAQGAWADLDNDGDLDLYVANRYLFSGGGLAKDRIYINDGAGKFTGIDVQGTDQTGIVPNGVSFADYDADGDLDIFEPAAVVGTLLKDVLLQNNGNFEFARIEIENSPETEYAESGAWGDYDDDGDLDLVVAAFGFGAQSYILKNLKSESGSPDFVVADSGDLAEIGISLGQAIFSLWGDLNNDGGLDLLVSAFDVGYNIKWRTITPGSGMPYYQEVTHNLGQGRDMNTASLADVDNDGDLDILGQMYPDYRYSVFINNGDGSEFIEEPLAPFHPEGKTSTEVALGDFNNDGYPDAFIGYQGLPGRLLANEGGENHWLKLSLRGTISNSSAVGAIVRLKATIKGEEVWQMRQVSAGGETFRVQHDMRPNFGLGDATVAEVVRIEWPSGVVQEMENVAADQILQVVEPPQLSIEPAVILSWPTSADGYVLYGTDSVDGPWAEIEAEVIEQDGQATVTVKATDRMKLYQLQVP